MREAWRELMFADCDQQAKLTRDPVAPAKRSEAAMKKVTRLLLEDGTPAHSSHSLMHDLSSITRNTCRAPSGAKDAPTFQVTTTPTDAQVIQCLAQLDRLGIIELKPLNRYRLKLSKAFRWRPHGPVMEYFRDHAMGDYFSGGFGGAGEGLLLVHGSVSKSLASTMAAERRYPK
jgi:hypothetical protein